jgi:hypothetical protein
VRETWKILPDEGRIEREGIKDGLGEARFVHQGMIAGHPDAATEAIGALGDKNESRDMDHL